MGGRALLFNGMRVHGGLRGSRVDISGVVDNSLLAISNLLWVMVKKTWKHGERLRSLFY